MRSSQELHWLALLPGGHAVHVLNQVDQVGQQTCIERLAILNGNDNTRNWILLPPFLDMPEIVIQQFRPMPRGSAWLIQIVIVIVLYS